MATAGWLLLLVVAASLQSVYRCEAEGERLLYVTLSYYVMLCYMYVMLNGK